MSIRQLRVFSELGGESLRVSGHGEVPGTTGHVTGAPEYLLVPCGAGEDSAGDASYAGCRK